MKNKAATNIEVASGKNKGDIALHIAVEKNYQPIVEELVNNSTTSKADLKAKNHDGYTAQEIADEAGHKDIEKFLDDTEKAIAASGEASGAKQNLVNLVKDIYNGGSVAAINPVLAKINPDDINTYLTPKEHGIAKVTLPLNPLTAAIMSGNADVVSLILNKGGDVNANINIIERSPIHYAAATKGDADIVKLLLADKSTKVDALDNSNSTALLMAANKKESDKDVLEIVSLLVKAGANPNEANKKGKTPLSVAKASKSKKIVSILEGKAPEEPIVTDSNVLKDHLAKLADELMGLNSSLTAK